ncbi:MAG: metalloregulator ArsR/SmtB family transcription factor [Thermoplasmataceae archaeon]
MASEEECPVRKLPPIDVSKYENLQNQISSLGNKYRIAILLEISTFGELCACDLVPVLKLSQSSVTLHLQKLYREGFLKKQERGKYTYYRLNEERKDILELFRMLDSEILQL